MDVTDAKALIFDVFGTVVDWRSSIIKQDKQFGRLYGIEADWDAFAWPQSGLAKGATLLVGG